MRKIIFTLLLCFLASICYAQPSNEVESNWAKENGNDRLVVRRILDGQNLNFQKNHEQTIFNLRVEAGDSIRFNCKDCWKLLQPEKDGNSNLSVSIQSKDGIQELRASDFENGWVKVNSSDGLFSLALAHGGTGKSSFTIDQFRVWQKTKAKQ